MRARACVSVCVRVCVRVCVSVRARVCEPFVEEGTQEPVIDNPFTREREHFIEELFFKQ